MLGEYAGDVFLLKNGIEELPSKIHPPEVVDLICKVEAWREG
jgi:hypothetical protein